VILLEAIDSYLDTTKKQLIADAELIERLLKEIDVSCTVYNLGNTKQLICIVRDKGTLYIHIRKKEIDNTYNVALYSPEHVFDVSITLYHLNECEYDQTECEFFQKLILVMLKIENINQSNYGDYIKKIFG